MPLAIDWGILLQLGGSLLAIVALWFVARQMGLGGDPRIIDVDHAQQLAAEGQYGFEGCDAVLDRGGYSALVRDAQWRHVLVWRLGNRFVTRMLTPPVDGRLDQDWLTLTVDEPGAEAITLGLGPAAQYWASGLRHIPEGSAHG